MATKLHELLAVEGDLRTQGETCRTDLKNTFEKKAHHFTKQIKTFHSFTEGVVDKQESQLALQTTVRIELDWIKQKLAKAIDAGHQIDVANTTASADVVLEDGTILLKSVPTTSLLRMEHRVLDVRDLVHAIPTLDPAKGFTLDTEEGANIFKARDVTTTRGEKQFSYVVMVQPTKEHPALVKELNLDKPIGTLLTQEWSSLITVAEKGDMLDRVESLLRAVKKARARANEVEIDSQQNRIGDTLLNFVFGGAKSQ